MLPIAVDAVGGDKHPARSSPAPPRRRPSSACPWSSSGRPTQIGDPMGLEVVPCTEVIDMHEEGAKAVRRKKDSSLVVAAEARPGRQGQRHAQRRQHGRDHRQRPPADGSPERRQPPGHRHAHPRARLDADRPARRRRQRRGPAGVARAVRPDGQRLRHRALRHRHPPGRPAEHRRGGGQGHRAHQGGVRAAQGGRRASTSSATSRVATSSPTTSTWSSPTASPATWRSRRSRAA